MDPMGIYGQSEMAGRIRAFDWASTSLGPILSWPESWKSVVNLMLQSPLAISCYYGPDRLHFYNDALATIIGGKHPHSLGRNVLETWSEIADDLTLHINRVMSGESWIDEGLQFSLDRGQGLEEAWFDVSFSPLIGPDLKPIGLFAVVLPVECPNIVELKKTQDALHEREERYRLLVEGGRVGVWDLDTETGVAFWNDYMYQMLGLPEDTRITQSLYLEKMHPDDVARMTAAMEAHLENNVPYSIEYRLRHSSGEYRYFLSHAETVRDQAGKPVRVMGIMMDITARKKAELENRKLLERERLIRGISELISHSFDTGYILSEAAQAIVTFFQVDRCLMMRYKQHSLDGSDLECVSQSCAELVSPVDEQTIPLKALNALSAGHISNYPQILDLWELPGGMPDYYRHFAVRWDIQACIVVEIAYREQRYGRIVLHQCRHPRKWAEDEMALLELLAIQVGAMLHQSELYQAEQAAKQQAESASQQKSQFLANMSHEFRTPLNAILGFSGLIARGTGGPLTPKQEKFIGNVLSSGQHMLAIVNDILDLSKVEAGQMTLELQAVDIPVLFNELSAVFEHMAESRNVTVQFDLERGLEQIQADPVRLRQILQNLIANAIKFNHEGGSVQVSAALADGVFRCQVQDTGNGIAPADVARLFSVFTQLDDGFSRKEEGTGLGLALTKRLVELHGGVLNVESKPEVGSTFSFTIPQH